MQCYSWSDVEKEQITPTLIRQMIHGETMTIAKLQLKKGCIVPVHSHVNEQISMVDQGVLRFVLAGEEVLVKAGEALHIPANVPHSAEALEDSVATDVFSPPRQDWISGDDAYLRR